MAKAPTGDWRFMASGVPRGTYRSTKTPVAVGKLVSMNNPGSEKLYLLLPVHEDSLPKYVLLGGCCTELPNILLKHRISTLSKHYMGCLSLTVARW